MRASTPGWVLDPPLDPSAEEARRLLGRELLHPDYHDQDLAERLLAWLIRLLERGLGAAAGAPPLSTLAAMIVAVALLGALAWLVSRARRSAHLAAAPGPVLDTLSLSAAELRARAERALADGRPAEALIEAFRALTVRQVERGRIDDSPGATAHEVAAALGAAHPTLRERLDDSALHFDLVRYGDRPADRDQVLAVFALDAALAESLTGRPR